MEQDKPKPGTNVLPGWVCLSQAPYSRLSRLCLPLVREKRLLLVCSREAQSEAHRATLASCGGPWCVSENVKRLDGRSWRMVDDHKRDHGLGHGKPCGAAARLPFFHALTPFFAGRVGRRWRCSACASAA